MRIVAGHRLIALLSLVLLLVSACAAPPQAGQAPPNSSTGGSQAPKRISAAIRSAPTGLIQQRTLRSVGSLRGLDAIEEMTQAGLTYVNGDAGRAPQLAEQVPSLDNGLWKLLPDGRMETTWKLRSNAVWQDGTALTSGDFVFAATIEQDKDLGISPYPAYDSVERIDTPDARTIVVAWKRPYIEADGMFSYRVAGLPVPKHLMEQAYNDDKATFLDLPYWGQNFVGAGAFKVRDWVLDSYTLLTANDRYVLGRPKIDEVEVKFIADPNALMANVLAGTELTLGKTISLDQATQVQGQWSDGRVLTRTQSWTPISAQFINPDPPIVANIQFRRAMLQAIDRPQLVEAIWSGQSTVANSYVSEDVALYHEVIEPSVVKYAYDPRQAAQMIEGLGYTKRADGFYYDGSGQKLSVQIYTTVQNDIHPKTTATVADYWQRLGVEVEQVLIPIQRAQDREYRATFPAFELVETTNAITPGDIRRLHSASTPLPENKFQVTGNNSRYRNPELDADIDRYITTIPMNERMQALGAVVHILSENLPTLPLFRGVDPTMVANRIVNVTARAEGWTQAWNVQDWEVKN